MIQKTWYVIWNEEHGSPKFKHDERDAAIDEAKRLARLNPGKQFHVLGLIGTAERVDVAFTEADEDGIPF